MTTPMRSQVVAHLRAVEEHYDQIEPSPAIEKRLRARFEAAGEKKSLAVFGGSWLRQYGRPMAIALAAGAVLILSVQDDAPPARSGLAVPNASDAAVEIEGAPEDERLEPANPHRRDVPRTPLTSGPERRESGPEPAPKDAEPIHRELPNGEALPEHGYFGPRMQSPWYSPNGPNPFSRDRSDGLGFWSPARGFSPDTGGAVSGMSGDVRTGAGAKGKTPGPRDVHVACVTAETWKERAVLDCEANGLVVEEISYLDPCGDGLFRDAEHECTDSSPDGETCTTDTIGEGDLCTDPGILKDLAYQICKATSQEMVDFTYVTDGCGWKTRQAKYTCCPVASEPPPPPPPVPNCQTVAIGDGTTCRDLGTIKLEAMATCEKMGQTLGDIQLPSSNCPQNQAPQAKVTCCAK